MSEYHENGHGEKRLRDYPQWMVWRWDGKNKPPINPRTGRKVDWTDPRNWLSYEKAAEKRRAYSHTVGVGIVLTRDDPFTLVDLDHCFVDGPEGKEVTPFASGVLRELRGVEEESVSGEGMHSLVRATKPGTECVSKDKGREIEVYDSARFVAIADESIVDKPIPERQRELAALYWRTFPQMSLVDEEPLERVAGTLSDADSHEPAHAPLTDAEVLEKASTNRVTGGLFRKLHERGDPSEFKSKTHADFKLCKLLAYWTKDKEQVDRLFRASALYQIIDQPDTAKYAAHTVSNAVKRQTKHYVPGEGNSLKEKVREAAEGHLEWIAGLEWSNETDRAVYEEVTRRAGEWAYLGENGALEFDVNQQSIAEAVGVSQRMVSKSLKRLREAELITRTSKGHTGRNSYYKILPFLPTDTPSAGATPFYCVTPLCSNTLERERDSPSTELPLHSRTVRAAPQDEGFVEEERVEEPLPEESPEPDGLPEDVPELDEGGWEVIG